MRQKLSATGAAVSPIVAGMMKLAAWDLSVRQRKISFPAI